MPNNHLGSNPDPDIVLPRAPIANDPGFSVMRTLDGHIPCNDDAGEYDESNPHEIRGGGF